MRRITACLCLVVACAGPVFADDFYKLYLGGDDTACAYPTATSANTDWAVTGSSAHEAVDDAQPIDQCMLELSSDYDSDTTYISCPITTTTCSITFDLANPGLSASQSILRVSPWMVFKKGVESGKTPPSVSLYFVISGVEYLACTRAATTTYAISYITCQADLSPATSAAWTSAELDGLQLRIKQTASASQTTYITAAGVAAAWSYDP